MSTEWSLSLCFRYYRMGSNGDSGLVSWVDEHRPSTLIFVSFVGNLYDTPNLAIRGCVVTTGVRVFHCLWFLSIEPKMSTYLPLGTR